MARLEPEELRINRAIEEKDREQREDLEKTLPGEEIEAAERQLAARNETQKEMGRRGTYGCADAAAVGETLKRSCRDQIPAPAPEAPVVPIIMNAPGYHAGQQA